MYIVGGGPQAAALLSGMLVNRQMCLTNLHHVIVRLQLINICAKQILDSGFGNPTKYKV